MGGIADEDRTSRRPRRQRLEILELPQLNLVGNSKRPQYKETLPNPSSATHRSIVLSSSSKSS